MRDLALKHPTLRQVTFSNELIPYRKVESSFDGKDFIKGDAQIIRNSFQFRIPILNWDTNSLSTTIAVLNQFVDLSHIESFNNQVKVDDQHVSKTTLNMAANFT